MKRLLLLAVLLVGGTTQLPAQSGSWHPPGADVTYLRTLLKARELAGVRALLAAPAQLALYRSLWADVQGAPPTDNTSARGRRARVTWAKNASSVVLLDRQRAAGNGLSALSAAQHEVLAASARSLLKTLNSDVEAFAI